VAALSVLVAFLGLGFGLVQMLNHPEPSAGQLSLAQTDLAAPTSGPNVLSAATVGGSVQAIAPAPSSPTDTQRTIQSNARVLEPNYTVAAGDTLVKIAQRFNTSVERIQAFNNLADPRALRVGTKLVIPAPL
jgi:LysM repeat protein